MAEYRLPELISDGRLDWAVGLLAASRTAGKGPLRLNWSKVEGISPAGHAILCCLFDSFVEQGNRVTCLFVPKRFKGIPAIRHLMELKSFPSLPPPSVHDLETRDLLLIGRTSLDVLIQERLREKFSRVLSENLLYDCLLILNELMQNTVDHSTAERYYLYAGSWEDEFHVGVLDMGTSIPAKMEQRYACGDDLAFLELALKEGTTTRRLRTGGVGLAYFFHFLKRNEGKLTIMSRGAQVRRYFQTRRSQRNLLKQPLRGTWCFARFSLGMNL